MDEFEDDVDLIINLDSRVVNVFIEDIPNYIGDRFQLTEVKAILIRQSLIKENNTATIHFFRVIDLNSSLMNFSLDYSTIYVEVENREFAVDFRIKKRGNTFEKN